MATAKTHRFPDLAPYVIRPALVEAKLITDKRAHDAVYVVTLTEELRNIEVKIAATEEGLQLGSSTAAVPHGTCLAPAEGPDANWIRTKSSELVLRLRRIEQLSKKR